MPKVPYPPQADDRKQIPSVWRATGLIRDRALTGSYPQPPLTQRERVCVVGDEGGAKLERMACGHERTLLAYPIVVALARTVALGLEQQMYADRRRQGRLWLVTQLKGYPSRMAYDVEYRGSPLGLVFAPANVASAPAILLLHGSEGRYAGWTHLNAYRLAAAGFIAAPFGYSRDGDSWFAGDIHDVELTETAKALRALRRIKNANGNVGLYGVSRGAEHALVLASRMARDAEFVGDLPKALAVHAASDIIEGAFIADQYHPKVNEPKDPTNVPWLWNGSASGLSPGTAIEIEHYGGPLLMSHGEDDDLWDVGRTRRLEARLNAAGRNPIANYYQGQGHGLYGDAHNLAHERLLSFFREHL